MARWVVITRAVGAIGPSMNRCRRQEKTKPARSWVMGACALACGLALGCGGQGTQLVPETMGKRAFDLLRADDFTKYFTEIVTTPTIVRALCPAKPGVERYFDSGEGSEMSQRDRWDQCRSQIDFGKAVFVGVRTELRPSDLGTPECAQPIVQVDVFVDVSVQGRPGTFAIRAVMQFGAGWRAYGRLDRCSVQP